jgi:hypothetical protein
MIELDRYQRQQGTVWIIHPDGEIREWPVGISGTFSVQGDVISIYSVGVLSDLRAAWASIRGRKVNFPRMRLRTMFRYLWGRIRERKWRELRNSFNGYLAEVDYPSSRVALSVTHCGHGWTKKRAIESLRRHVATITERSTTP